MVSPLLPQLSTCPAQDSAFTYQGRLEENGTPDNGRHDFRGQTFNRAAAGDPGDGPVSSTATLTAVPATHGSFVPPLRLGTALIPGARGRLERCRWTDGWSPFVALTPRPPTRPSAYVIHAASADAAGLTGPLPTGGLIGGYPGLAQFPNPGNLFTRTFAVDGPTRVNAAR
jgi:hypothetical protein